MIRKFVFGAAFMALSIYAQAALLVINPVSDLMVQAKFAAQYAQSAAAYSNQLLQYQMQVKNLLEHPLGVVMPDLNVFVNNAAKLMANGKQISNNMSSVSVKIDKVFDNPDGTYAEKFKNWTDTSGDALKGAMLNAGLQREQFVNDTTALQALITKNAASGGALAAAKTLGEIAAAQLQESMKLRELITSQQLATSQYQLAQQEILKGQKANNDAVTQQFTDAFKTPIPQLDTSKKIAKKWNLYPGH